MNIIIERALPLDSKEILTYLKQVGGETDNLTFGAEGLPFSVEAEAEYIGSMGNSGDDIMLVAKESGKIVGIANLNRLPRRMSHRGDFGISVAKQHWNRGIGGMLMTEIIEFAKLNKFEIIDLQVRSDNVAAIHLYEKFGFKKMGTHPAFHKVNGYNIPYDFMSLEL